MTALTKEHITHHRISRARMCDQARKAYDAHIAGVVRLGRQPTVTDLAQARRRAMLAVRGLG